MMEELISVVVPAYNCAPWLPRCLDSLLKQTYAPLEVIVVNDGSKDDTARIMESYAARDSRIHCIHQENGGVTRARLHGVREASGQWIGFADSDDALEPQMLERLMGNAKKYNADISHCGFQEIWSDGTINQMHGTGILKVQSRQESLRDLLEETLVEPGLWTKLFKKSLFEGLEEQMDLSVKINEDILMNYLLFDKVDTAVFEDVSLYHYMIHEGSASRRKLNQNLIYDPIRVRQIIYDRCDPEMKDDARRALVRMCLVSYRQLAMEKGSEYSEDRKNVREIIRQQLPYCHILSRRNAVLVKLIIAAPWVFDVLYPPFERMFRK